MFVRKNIRHIFDSCFSIESFNLSCLDLSTSILIKKFRFGNKTFIEVWHFFLILYKSQRYR